MATNNYMDALMLGDDSGIATTNSTPARSVAPQKQMQPQPQFNEGEVAGFPEWVKASLAGALNKYVKGGGGVGGALDALNPLSYEAPRATASSLASGYTFGGSDLIASALSASAKKVTDKITGANKYQGTGMQDLMRSERDQMERERQNNPALSTAANVGGAIVNPVNRFLGGLGFIPKAGSIGARAKNVALGTGLGVGTDVLTRGGEYATDVGVGEKDLNAQSAVTALTEDPMSYALSAGLGGVGGAFLPKKLTSYEEVAKRAGTINKAEDLALSYLMQDPALASPEALAGLTSATKKGDSLVEATQNSPFARKFTQSVATTPEGQSVVLNYIRGKKQALDADLKNITGDFEDFSSITPDIKKNAKKFVGDIYSTRSKSTLPLYQEALKNKSGSFKSFAPDEAKKFFSEYYDEFGNKISADEAMSQVNNQMRNSDYFRYAKDAPENSYFYLQSMRNFLRDKAAKAPNSSAKVVSEKIDEFIKGGIGKEGTNKLGEANNLWKKYSQEIDDVEGSYVGKIASMQGAEKELSTILKGAEPSAVKRYASQLDQDLFAKAGSFLVDQKGDFARKALNAQNLKFGNADEFVSKAFGGETQGETFKNLVGKNNFGKLQDLFGSYQKLGGLKSLVSDTTNQELFPEGTIKKLLADFGADATISNKGYAFAKLAKNILSATKKDISEDRQLQKDLVDLAINKPERILELLSNAAKDSKKAGEFTDSFARSLRLAGSSGSSVVMKEKRQPRQEEKTFINTKNDYTDILSQGDE